MADLAELDWDVLKRAALAVRQRAWCPYSKFAVGAAAMTHGGSIYAGCNVENASYGLSICAERSAVVQAVASGDREIRAIAICAEPLAWPCGACRQFIVEFGADIEIRAFSPVDMGQVVGCTIRELLPHFFRFQPPLT